MELQGEKKSFHPFRLNFLFFWSVFLPDEVKGTLFSGSAESSQGDALSLCFCIFENRAEGQKRLM